MLGAQKQKHKKQPFSDASASHLSLVLLHVWFQAGAWISQTTTLTPPSYEVGGIAKRIKTARRSRRKTPDDKMVSWKKLHQIPQNAMALSFLVIWHILNPMFCLSMRYQWISIDD